MLKGQSREVIKEGFEEDKDFDSFSNLCSHSMFSFDLEGVGMVKF